MSYIPINWTTQTYYPAVMSSTPSAPPLEDPNNMTDSVSLYPHLVPPSLPVIDFQARANQAYKNVWNDLHMLHRMPVVNMDDISMQTLMEIEEKSKKGFVPGLLNLISKVIRVAGYLAFGLAGFHTGALILAALSGVPFGLALIVTSPLLSFFILTGLVCKVAAQKLEDLNKHRKERSFQNAIQAQNHPVLSMKPWIQLQDIPQLEKRLQDTLNEIQLAQTHVCHDPLRAQQYVYIQSQIGKIYGFQAAEKRIKKNQFFMPLLRHYLGIS